MLRSFTRTPSASNLKYFHSSSPDSHALKQRYLRSDSPVSRNTKTKEKLKDREDQSIYDEEALIQRHVKRNELGVQLLSRGLHSQIFKSVSFPSPPPSYVQISKEHLRMHGLDPSQGSVLPDINFQLPPLQGSNISEHFHRIGVHAAEPWLTLARSLSSAAIPPKPDNWHIQSGWTKYHYAPDGSSYSEHVKTPVHNGSSEQLLVFDVETMPNQHPYAVMACAASPNAWYAWISPWLLGESKDPQHFIPLGDPATPRVVVGHNISYDRIRIADEYNVPATSNRFLDTMSLHIAVNGISSHQRPSWMKYRKSKQEEEEQKEEAVEAVEALIRSVTERQKQEADTSRKEEFKKLLKQMEASLLMLQAPADEDGDISADEIASKRWEDITSANSLADVAKLHCGIRMDKEIRNDLMESEPQHIRDNITDYLDYCANDVDITHRVYSKTLPAFLRACPHPVSFSGILTMGSSFLTVDENWTKYLENADAIYHEMEEKVQSKLKKLAEEARDLMNDEQKWMADPWLGQLDWEPKVAGKSRGVLPAGEVTTDRPQLEDSLPAWHEQLVTKPLAKSTVDLLVPLLLKISYDNQPVYFDEKEGWHQQIDGRKTPLPLAKGRKMKTILSKSTWKHFTSGSLTTSDLELTKALCGGADNEEVSNRIVSYANILLQESRTSQDKDPWISQLEFLAKPKRVKKPKPLKPPPVLWPKWYWEATKPKKGMPPGTLEVTVRTRIAPILLRLSWLGYPLVHSREHGWTFRVPTNANFKTRLSPLKFYDPADDKLSEAVLSGTYVFYKVPHKDGEKANVANPLGKSFIKYAQDGTLKSPGNEAKEALDLNSLCSYWISARDRITNQLVVWQDSQRSLGLPSPTDSSKKYGIILPQVITMGTVTRRAIEKTWLTASNAKKNRVGSELKAMVRAPEGYAIVGADVDSEELWISSCMGDAQFGLHGASAIGWMTLEGTKAAGTDLHSKTASILGISRDQAKVFNYSRIYGAGMRHAILLLLQSNPSMLPDEAQKLAENLYASTKGKNTHRSDIFERKFWFGGTESYLFNKLEEIAISDKPQTPALGCGVTYALSKEYLPEGFGSDFMPSRINWVVQSSGVDYLHLLIVAMNHLVRKYDINARYLISVHDELRYLVAEEDKYRVALALQIANLWTRSMFAYNLGMDDLPQGVAFFSAVDVDAVLRKEVDMPCVTPSQPIPIPPGESLDIMKVLQRTNGGSLQRDGLPMARQGEEELEGNLVGYTQPDCLSHRANNAAWLQAQATTDFGEVKGLAQQVYGKQFTGNATKPKVRRKKAPIGTGEGFDWSEHAERILMS
ncbi:unnamed protein product [Cyclocybe aegerita]|uniref:Mitochondrial DNA polymerase catalytic subunit n=1 Tax=Cyclocybe aegerita TaxID=1973307 RepID=A0A8S0XS99_CYCAE|nr:unnamed protein product [Cyclocybe aegerita]